MDEQTTTLDEQTAETKAQAADRKPYTAPELVEYGDVAVLTQEGGGDPFDGVGGDSNT